MAIPFETRGSVLVLISHEFHELFFPFFPAQRLRLFGCFIYFNAVFPRAGKGIPHLPAFSGGAFCCPLAGLHQALVPEFHQLLQPLGLHLGHCPGLVVHLAHAQEGFLHGLDPLLHPFLHGLEQVRLLLGHGLHHLCPAQHHLAAVGHHLIQRLLRRQLPGSVPLHLLGHQLPQILALPLGKIVQQELLQLLIPLFGIVLDVVGQLVGRRAHQGHLSHALAQPAGVHVQIDHAVLVHAIGALIPAVLPQAAFKQPKLDPELLPQSLDHPDLCPLLRRQPVPVHSPQLHAVHRPAVIAHPAFAFPARLLARPASGRAVALRLRGAALPPRRLLLLLQAAAVGEGCPDRLLVQILQQGVLKDALQGSGVSFSLSGSTLRMGKSLRCAQKTCSDTARILLTCRRNHGKIP